MAYAYEKESRDLRAVLRARERDDWREPRGVCAPRRLSELPALPPRAPPRSRSEDDQRVRYGGVGARARQDGWWPGRPAGQREPDLLARLRRAEDAAERAAVREREARMALADERARVSAAEQRALAAYSSVERVRRDAVAMTKYRNRRSGALVWARRREEASRTGNSALQALVDRRDERQRKKRKRKRQMRDEREARDRGDPVRATVARVGDAQHASRVGVIERAVQSGRDIAQHAATKAEAERRARAEQQLAAVRARREALSRARR